MEVDQLTLATLLPSAAMDSKDLAEHWAVMTDDEREQYRAASAKWAHNWQLACQAHKRIPGTPVVWWIEFNAKHEAKRARLHAELQRRISKHHASASPASNSWVLS